MSYTFDGLNIGRSGVQAARGNLNITGQNITNVNTEGYTRQRVNQGAMAPSSTDMMYSPGSVVYGEGVEINSIEQMRDAFLDGEYRSQNAVSSSSSAINDALQYIEQIFYTTGSDGTDEDSTSIVDSLNTDYGKFISQLESLTASSNTSNENNVLSAAKNMATAFNTASKALDKAWDQQYTNLTNYAVKDANGLLKNIASLNDKIKDSELAGTPALELRDQRNLYIDKLSQYCNIKVTETPTEISVDKTIYTMSIQLTDNSGNPKTYTVPDPNHPGDTLTKTYDLVNGDEYAQFSATKSASKVGLPYTSSYDYVNLNVSKLSKDGTGAVIPNDDYNTLITSGKFSGYLKLLNESGEADDIPGSSYNHLRGIGYYKNLLDKAASGFADTVNKANSTNDDDTVNKPLFTSANGASHTGITAGNIRTATAWADAIKNNSTDHYLTFTKDLANVGDNKDTSFSNITDMVETLDKSDISGSILNIGKTLGIEIDSANSDYNSKNSVLNSINNNRLSLSAVDIDDETVNLIKFNQALGASARFITTVDECLNTLINNTGIVGR